MRKEDCKEGLKIVYLKDTEHEEYGTITTENGSVLTVEKRCAWVKWSDDTVTYVSLDCIEPLELIEYSLTLSEFYAILDEIVADSDDCSQDEWYTTDRTFTRYGIDKVRTYLKEKITKPDLKAQALAKLTPEEIKALGIKV